MDSPMEFRSIRFQFNSIYMTAHWCHRTRCSAFPILWRPINNFHPIWSSIAFIHLRHWSIILFFLQPLRMEIKHYKIGFPRIQTMMPMIDDNVMHQVMSTAIGSQFLNISIFHLCKSAKDFATRVFLFESETVHRGGDDGEEVAFHVCVRELKQLSDKYQHQLYDYYRRFRKLKRE